MQTNCGELRQIDTLSFWTPSRYAENLKHHWVSKNFTDATDFPERIIHASFSLGLFSAARLSIAYILKFY